MTGDDVGIMRIPPLRRVRVRYLRRPQYYGGGPAGETGGGKVSWIQRRTVEDR